MGSRDACSYANLEMRRTWETWCDAAVVDRNSTPPSLQNTRALMGVAPIPVVTDSNRGILSVLA